MFQYHISWEHAFYGCKLFGNELIIKRQAHVSITWANWQID